MRHKGYLLVYPPHQTTPPYTYTIIYVNIFVNL